jgi:hypothetical protein
MHEGLFKNCAVSDGLAMISVEAMTLESSAEAFLM